MCDVTAAVVAGTAVAGAASAATSKPKTATTNTSSTNSPWAPQAEHLQTGMDEAARIYEDSKATGAYTGDLSADQNATQQQGYGTLTGYANGTGGSLASQAGQGAGALMGATTPFVQNASGLAANGIGGMNATTQGVLTGAANGQTLGQTTASGAAGLSAQQGALTTAQSLTDRAAGDPNAAILAGANGYVNNDLLQGQIDAVNRDVSRTLSEETLPGLNARAMAGGNVNSARAGAAEAIARRGAEDRAADNAATIRADAYKTGLSTSLAAQDQQNSLALGANAQTAAVGQSLSAVGESQRQYDGTQQLDAATTLGAQDLAARQADANVKTGANAQLGQAALSGFDAASTAGALSDANAGRLITAGDAQQAEENRAIQESMANQYNQQNYDKAMLNDYWGVVGSNNWGSASTGTQTTTQPANNGISGILQGAAGGASIGAGLMSMGGASSVGSGFSAPSQGPNTTTSPGALSVEQMLATKNPYAR
jgi:hypothetical protein